MPDALAGLTLPRDLWIDGEAHPAADGRTLDVVSPRTDTVIGVVARGGRADVDAAVAAGRRAFAAGDWSLATPAERRAVLLRLARLVEDHADELALLESVDMGKLLADARAGDVPDAAATLRFYAEAIDKRGGEVAPTGPSDLVTVTREPLGVVGAVVPWNYPLLIAMWKVAPALAAGNSVVLKPAEQSPLTALRLGELGTLAGLPDGVLNVVSGLGPEAGEALGRHRDVDALTFTGSTSVGGRFLTYAGESNLKRVSLECGGKSPCLVFADADLERAAALIAGDIFANQGQVCSAHSRVLVDRAVHAELVQRVVAHAEALVLGDPLDPASTIGPLVDQAHADRVMAYVEAARDDARLATGGERLTLHGSAAYVTPTVFDAVSPQAPLSREEVFGPVLAVTPFAGEREALALANDSRYGLAASLFTADIDRALRLGRRLRAGTVSINTVDALDPVAPFGGVKESGSGRDLSLHALDEYSALKTTWVRIAKES